jgi:hypothetical protein
MKCVRAPRKNRHHLEGDHKILHHYVSENQASKLAGMFSAIPAG